MELRSGNDAITKCEIAPSALRSGSGGETGRGWVTSDNNVGVREYIFEPLGQCELIYHHLSAIKLHELPAQTSPTEKSRFIQAYFRLYPLVRPINPTFHTFITITIFISKLRQRCFSCSFKNHVHSSNS